MKSDLIRQMTGSLATSDSALRKYWAQRIVDEDVTLDALISLLHAKDKTAQRFMWFLDDLCRLAPERVSPLMPLLFSLRDQMPFPGMRRSVAKWLWLTQIPKSVEKDASRQLLDWLANAGTTIACKSFSAKGLELLVDQKRAPRKKLIAIVMTEAQNPNRAYASRMQKLHVRLGSPAKQQS